MKREKGFTLIELIVVIAIIGILAAILVPTLMGFVSKAKKKSDIASARLISQNIVEVFSEDDDVIVSFYSSSNTTKIQVTEGSDTYNFVVVCQMDGAKHSGGSNEYAWTPTMAVCQDFADALNDEMGFNASNQTIKIAIKYKSGSKTSNKWMIGYREDNPNTIEVWVGDGSSSAVAQPNYRLWSEASREYRQSK